MDKESVDLISMLFGLSLMFFGIVLIVLNKPEAGVVNIICGIILLNGSRRKQKLR
jgi:hypothetical protein